MTHSAAPRVSVILPTHNPGAGIARAVASVLGQTFKDFELVIVDDGSSALPALPDDARVRTVRNVTNVGLQKSLNRGLAESRGEYIARIDDDDEWCSPQKLAEQVEYLDEHPGVGVVGTCAIITDDRGREAARYAQPLTDAGIRRAILLRNPLLHVSVLVRREAFGSGYDESAASRYAEDYELWLRIGQTWQLANLAGYDVKFAMHNQSSTGQHKLQQCQNFTSLIVRYHASYQETSYWYALARSKVREVLYGRLGLLNFKNSFFLPHAKSKG